MRDVAIVGVDGSTKLITFGSIIHRRSLLHELCIRFPICFNQFCTDLIAGPRPKKEAGDVSFRIGAIFGTVAAMIGGVADRLAEKLFVTISAFPAVILALAIIALYGSRLSNLVLLAALVFVPHFGRIASSRGGETCF